MQAFNFMFGDPQVWLSQRVFFVDLWQQAHLEGLGRSG